MSNEQNGDRNSGPGGGNDGGNSPPGHGGEHGFKIRIDRQDFTVRDEELTGTELRGLPDPDIGLDRDLFEIVPGGSDKKIELTVRVKMRNGLRFRRYEEALRKTPTDPVARMMFDKFDPAIVQKFQMTAERARVVAENLLKRQGMAFSKITSSLLNVDIWKSHNQMISAQDAEEIGLNVTFIDQEDPLWEKIWQLHCLQRLATEDKQTLFESYYVSLPM